MPRYIIPCRKGSKGFPGKNRKLVPHLISQLSPRQRIRTVVTTDDEKILDFVDDKSAWSIDRPKELAEDETSIKPVLEHAIDNIGWEGTVVLLYPTYPERDANDIIKFLSWYNYRGKPTSLCCQPATPETPTHLAIERKEDGRGEFPYESRPIPYRRQDAEGTIPNTEGVKELSHFICAFESQHLPNLSKNLFNENTKYFEMDERVIDVDYEEDWNEYISQSEDNGRTGV